jgi:predicted metalloprotease with PDZ domain
VDLNLFDFDYDLTFMVFFLNAGGEVYARYGGRDAEGPDKRQSLEGLRYTMESVLRMHARAEKTFAPKAQAAPRFIRGVAGARRGGGCLHCHQVKEILNADLQRKGQWSQNLVWRYPLPENLGFALEIDRGNVVKEVKGHSPAAAAGLAAGDVVQRLGGVPIHSFADAQFALDRAPSAGSIEVVWQRGVQTVKDGLPLPEGWRKTDISWRPSMQHVVPSARLYGADLTPAEKRALGLEAKQLAFRQKHPLSAQAREAGIREGDVVLGSDGAPPGIDREGFLEYVRSNYLAGDRLTVHVLRGGRRLRFTMTLQ